MRIGAALATLLSWLLGGGPASAQQLDTPERILQFLAEHRGDTALVSFTVAPGGTPDPADPVILLNPDQPMPLASTIKIVVLAAYAREVAAGRIDPDQPVAVAEWERFYLPGTDGGAHAASLQARGIATDAQGFAQDLDVTVTWDVLARSMIRFSDNAATDLILERLGDGALRATLAEAGLGKHPLPLSILGMFLSWENHEQGPLTPRKLKRLKRLTAKAYAAEIKRLRSRFQDESWRQAELNWRQKEWSTSYKVQAQATQLRFPKANAREYSRMLAGVLEGTFPSPAAAPVMREHLGWPMEIPGNAEIFLTFGDKGGALPGVLTDAMYFTPRRGDFGDKPHVSVLFLRNLGAEGFESLLDSFAHQEFLVRLGLDRGFAEDVKARLSER